MKLVEFMILDLYSLSVAEWLLLKLDCLSFRVKKLGMMSITC
jgi:hypothetical protein